MVGPVVKIAEEDLPRAANIHYLGAKPYAELPSYIAGWDVAMMPFAQNAATRFISPTKTLEYLAAGRPVVSTPVPDVVAMFAGTDLVRIAGSAAAFVAAIEGALGHDRAGFARDADAFIAPRSWDATWDRMWAVVAAALRQPAAERRSPAAAGRRREPDGASVIGRGARP